MFLLEFSKVLSVVGQQLANIMRQVAGNSAPMLKTLGYPALPHEALWVDD